MKAKILTALKNKYANLGLSEQKMEGAAGLIAGFVKGDAEIEGAISDKSRKPADSAGFICIYLKIH